MPVQRIRQLGDPILRQVCHPIEPSDSASVLTDLADTLHWFQQTRGFGRGIAAPQIGEAVRAIYIEFDGKAYSLLNPRYLSRSAEMFCLWDDCFSFPDLLVQVERHQSVDLEYQDRAGIMQILRAEGALAELVQHEMDHLDGILAVDRALNRDSLRTREEHLRILNHSQDQ